MSWPVMYFFLLVLNSTDLHTCYGGMTPPSLPGTVAEPRAKKPRTELNVPPPNLCPAHLSHLDCLWPLRVPRLPPSHFVSHEHLAMFPQGASIRLLPSLHLHPGRREGCFLGYFEASHLLTLFFSTAQQPEKQEGAQMPGLQRERPPGKPPVSCLHHPNFSLTGDPPQLFSHPTSCQPPRTSVSSSVKRTTNIQD